MVGGSIQHGTLVSTLARKIGNHLEAKPCQVFSEGTKVKTPTPHKRADYVYPDVVVDCSVEKAEDNMLTTPVLIFEVLSALPADMMKQQSFKFMPAFQHYKNMYWSNGDVSSIYLKR